MVPHLNWGSRSEIFRCCFGSSLVDGKFSGGARGKAEAVHPVGHSVTGSEKGDDQGQRQKEKRTKGGVVAWGFPNTDIANVEGRL